MDNEIENKIEEVKNFNADLISKMSAELKEAVAPKIPAQAKKEENKSFGEFVCLVHNASGRDYEKAHTAKDRLANKYNSTKVLIEGGGGTDGGYTVPEDFRGELLRIDPWEHQLWANVRKLPVTTDTIHFPVLDQSSGFTGGMAIAFKNESTAPSGESNPIFTQLTLQPTKLIGYTELSSEVLADNNVGLANEVMNLFKEAIAHQLENQILNGSGMSNQFDGIIDNAATVEVSRDDSGEFQLVDAAKMYSRFVGNNGLWVVHPYMFEKLANINTVNNALSWLPSITGRPQLSLLGFPVARSIYSPNVGDAGDVVLLDPSKYLVALRQDIVISTSEHLRFLEDRIVFRVVMRVNGKPSIAAPITTDGNDVSAFVQLGDLTS